MAHEQSLDGCVSRMERRKCTKHQGRGREGGGVEIDAEKFVDSGKAGGGAFHGIICWSQAIHVFIPRRGAREENLYHHPDQIDIAEAAGEDRDGGRRCKEEHEDRADERAAEVDDAVR